MNIDIRWEPLRDTYEGCWRVVPWDVSKSHQQLGDYSPLSGFRLETGECFPVCGWKGAGHREDALVVGVGNWGEVDSALLFRLSAAAVRYLASRFDSLVLVFDQRDWAVFDARLMAEGCAYGTHRTKARRVSVRIATAESSEAEVARGLSCGELVNYARSLVDLDPGQKAPEQLAERVGSEIAERKLECTILRREQIEREGWGLTSAVGGGSSRPPAVLLLEYRGRQGNRWDLGLVGKGVCLDVGGINLKEGEKRNAKVDMAGGASVIATARFIAREALPLNVMAVVPLVDNVPDGSAYRPGQVVRALNGLTVEVTNCDAEGRLILAEGLAWCQLKGCRLVVDIATLTSSCAFGLGLEVAGLYGNDDDARDRLLRCARSAGEPLWPMPLYRPYEQAIKSACADLRNWDARYGDSIVAALFLSRFTGGCTWLHIDAPGAMYRAEGGPWHVPGATGFGVRTLSRFAQVLSESPC